MPTLRYTWIDGDAERTFEMVRVEGTNGRPYTFGEGAGARPIEVPEFFLATVPVTQALWTHVMGDENPSCRRGAELPLENVSWDEITRPAGFLDRLNAHELRGQMLGQASLKNDVFRLPSETEWEYAARGGPHWHNGFRFSGSNDIDLVAWYDRRHGDWTQEVALKAANQLGIYDMSGNVWEWCQDTYTEDLTVIPTDGSEYRGEGLERVLRGGCFHNWAIHCTVSKRYQIDRDYHDGCIGLRVVLGKAKR